MITPDPQTFSLLSVLGSSDTAQISQQGYNGPFTLSPTNPIICGNGITNIPITASISGSTLTTTLGLLGVTGECTITVDGYPGTSGTETVDLTVPVGSLPASGPITFSPDPVVFDVLNAVTGQTATTTIAESGYTGAFTLPATPIVCPFDLLPLTGATASISGTTLTIKTGVLNADLLGSCDVTVDDANGNTGTLVVDFELLPVTL